MKRKFLGVFIAVIFQLGLINISATSGLDWDSFGGNRTNSKLNYSKTIKNVDQIEEKFVSGSFKEPLIVNDTIYVVDSNGINDEGKATEKADLVIMDLDGQITKRIPLNGKVGFFSRIAYGDGKVFVALSKSIQAIDVKSGKSLWVSDDLNGQVISSLLYYNGCLYTGIATKASAGTEPSDGYFIAFKTTDEDPNNPTEIKKELWKWEEDKGTGFYWSGPAIVNNAIVFVGDGGIVLSHHLTKPIIYDKYVIDGKENKSRSTVYYNENNSTLYIGTQNSKKLVSIKMNKEKFVHDSVKVLPVSSQLSGGVKGDGKYIYASSGGMSASSGGLFITDNNLNLTATETNYATQSVPIINKAYANKENDNETFLYFLDFDSGKFIISTNNDKGEYKHVAEYTPKNIATYNSNSVSVTNDGTLIFPISKFPSGGGLVFLKNKNADFNTQEMKDLINSLPTQVNYSDYEKIVGISYQYNRYKANNGSIDNEKVLNDAQIELENIRKNKINEVITLINQLPTSLSSNKSEKDAQIKLIRAADYAYHGLINDDQSKVTNKAKLDKALQEADDEEIVLSLEVIKEKVDSYNKNGITLSSLVDIYKIEDAYNKLSSEEQETITNYDEFIKLKLETENIGLRIFQAKEIINDLPINITLKNEKDISTALTTYNNLSNNEKNEVNKGFTLKIDNKLVFVAISLSDYNYLKDCNGEIIKLKSIVKNGNMTYYYKLIDGKWFNYQARKQSGKTAITYYYSLDKAKLKVGDRKPGNGARLNKTITKSGTKTTTVLYKLVNKVNKSYKSTIVTKYKTKNITTFSRSIAYYNNGKIKSDSKLAKSYKTNKMTSKNKTLYRSNGKKQSYIKFGYKNGKYSSRLEYVYNKAGQTKTNKHGKAYRYTTTYNKKGKAIKTTRRQYNANGKLAKKAVNVKKRTTF